MQSTLEQYLGIDDPFLQDFPGAAGATLDRSGQPDPDAGERTGPIAHSVSTAGAGYSADPGDSGMPDMSNGDAPASATEPTPQPTGADASVTTPETGGPARTRREPVPLVHSTADGGTVDNREPPPSPTPTPTPPATDYSQLNQILSQLLATQQANTAGNTDFKNNIRNTILGLVKSGSAPVDPNDPTITSATSAFRGEGERALALLREKQAEAARAGGRTAGSEESAVKSGYEDLGNATGAYAANLQIQELNARRQQLMQAAQLGAGVSTAEESAALQSQIAAIDGQLKELTLKTNSGLTQQGITNQNAQFYDNLATNMGSQTNELDALLAKYLLSAA